MSKYRVFLIGYPDEAGNDIGEILTEEAIEKFYRPYVDSQAEKLNRPKLSHEELLEEFSIIHWAEELPND